MALAAQIPKTAIIVPSGFKVVSQNPLTLQKVKRSRRRFKMSKAQRTKIAAASRKFKIPLLTGLAIGPAVIISAIKAQQNQGRMTVKLFVFVQQLVSFYTGMIFGVDGRMTFEPQRLAIGYGPLIGIGVAKALAKGRIMAVNRALSRAQIPANLS